MRVAWTTGVDPDMHGWRPGAPDQTDALHERLVRVPKPTTE
jgi:hypothetical protein